MQPTPENKPKSKVIIRKVSAGSVLRVLGTPAFKGAEWIKGGKPSRGFGGFFGGGGGGFAKGKKLKQAVLALSSSESPVDVNYSTTAGKLTFALSFIQAGTHCFEDDY